MEALTIRAASPESARDILNALSDFPAELVELGFSSTVVVSLEGDAQIASMLNALQNYFTERTAGAAQLEYNGNSYVMHSPSEPGGL